MKYLIIGLTVLLTACGGGGASFTPVSANGQTAPFVVLGDSISAGYHNGTVYITDLTVAWPAVTAALIGREAVNLSVYGGDEPWMFTSELPRLPANTTLVVYSGGTNDVYHGPEAGLTQAQVVARIDDMVAGIHAQAPQAKIVFLNVRRYASVVKGNQATRDLETAWNAHERTLGTVVDIQDRWLGDTVAYPDGCHPSIAQAQVLGQMMAAVLH